MFTLIFSFDVVPGSGGWLDDFEQYIGWIVAVGIVVLFVIILFGNGPTKQI